MSLRLLVELTTGGVLYRLSDENIYDLTNKWDGFVTSFSGVNWRLTKRYGGYAKYNIGELVINQNFWTSSPPPWVPEQLVTLNIYYTLSTEAAKVLIVSGTGYRLTQPSEDVVYAVYPSNDNSYILSENYLKTSVTNREINDGAEAVSVYAWTLSGSGTGEYYCTLLAGTDPSISDPDRFYFGGVINQKGTVGALSDQEWGYGDNDVLGFSTVYWRFFGVDPDAQATGNLRIDYGTVAAAVPRALGEVINKIPAQLPDIAVTNPTTSYSAFDAAGIKGTGAKQITNITNPGGGAVTITSTAHGFTNGDSVVLEIQKGDYYNGTYVISGVVANAFNITKTYIAPTVTTGHAYKSGYWRFYVDGDPYIGVAALNTTFNFFSLTPRVTGRVTMSGTGYNDAGSSPIAVLTDLGSLAAIRLGLSLTSTGSRSPSPPIARWETKQLPIRDWLGLALAYGQHCGWDDGTTLYMRELFYVPGAGSTAFTEFDVLENVNYNDENTPLGLVVANVEFSDWEQEPGTRVEIPYQTTDYYFAENIDVDAFHTNSATVETELALIAQAMQRRNVTLTVSETFFTSLPDPADRYIMTDTYLPQDQLIHGNTAALEFDFDKDLITLVLKQILSTL